MSQWVGWRLDRDPGADRQEEWEAVPWHLAKVTTFQCPQFPPMPPGSGREDVICENSGWSDPIPLF